MSAFEGFIFYCAAATMLLSGVGVITLRNPVHCALLLVLSFISAAVLWLLLGAEFLAWVLVLVYVGAVMVLFLFVVMMLDVNFDRLKEGLWKYFPIGVLVSLVLGVQVYLVINSGVFGTDAYPAPKSATVDKDYSHAQELGEVIYTDYLLAFEAAAVVLLVAIVAAIALTLRKRPENKQLDPSEQVVVKASDRFSMEQVVLDKPEPKPGEDEEEEGEDSEAMDKEQRPQPEGSTK